MLVIGDNFSYGGAKPLDARLNYNTLAQMKAVADATMYNGCMAYCSESDKTYQWKSTNTVDETTGKWREFSSGGGGGSYTAGDGIDITDDTISIDPMPAEDVDEVIDVYPTAGNLVSIVNAFNKSDLYSTEEKMIGQWTDGKPLYQKTFVRQFPEFSSEGLVNVDLSNLNVDIVVKMEQLLIRPNDDEIYETRVNSALVNNNVVSNKIIYISSDHHIDITSNRTSDSLSTIYLTVQYTKVTDTAISIGEATEYSTDEKVVGTWIDGKPIYQKTFQIVMPTVVEDGKTTTGDRISIGADVEHFIDIRGMTYSAQSYYIIPDSRLMNESSPQTGSYIMRFALNNYSASSEVKNTFSIKSNNATLNGCSVVVTVQYTKVTT